MSPLLFLLVMEVLSRLSKRTEEGGFLRGFQADSHSQGGMHISHLLFVDDAILFCDATKEQLLGIRMVMIFFKAIIGLKVNIGKSEIVPMGVVGSLNALASVLGCNIVRLLIVYLGMPFGAHFNDSSIWNPITERLSLEWY